MLRIALAAAVAALSLSACTSDAERCQQSSNPGECMKWADAGGDVSDYLVGGMAGYMLANVMQGGRQQTVIVQNPGYHGPYRSLRTPLLSRDRQIAKLQAKVASQKAELGRQQAANASKKAYMRSTGSWGSYKSSTRSSWGSSSRSSFRSSGRRR